MALLLKNGAVFLHIPKTGGNWVTRVLEDLSLVECRIGQKHSNMERTLRPESFSAKEWMQPIRRAKNKLLGREVSNDNYMFCFVRNPLTWYESWWKYMSQPSRQWRSWGVEGDKYRWHPNAALNGLGDDDFNQFVRNVVRKHPGYVTELYAGYVTAAVEFVGRQERLVDDMIAVLNAMDVTFDEQKVRALGPVGASPAPKRPIEWNPALREEVERVEYAGLVRFGYAATRV